MEHWCSCGTCILFYRISVISTWKEPIGGWTAKAFAPTAFFKNVMLGFCTALLATDDFIFDMVPADYTVNALIAAAWDVHNWCVVRYLETFY